MLQAALVSFVLLGQTGPECASLPPAPRADVSVRVNSPEVIPTPAPVVERPVECGTVLVPVAGRCRVVVDAATGRVFLVSHAKRRSRVVALNGVRVGVSAGSAFRGGSECWSGWGDRVRVRSRGGGRCRVSVRCR
jgi:hypothetical protein